MTPYLTMPCPIAGKYTIFGQVIDGMDVLDKIEKIPTGRALYSSEACMASFLYAYLARLM